MYFRIVYKIQTRHTPCPPRGGPEPLHSCASLQVLFDLGRVFAVETLRLLVELGVPLVDVVDVGVVVVGPASAVLGPLIYPVNRKSELCQRRFRRSAGPATRGLFKKKNQTKTGAVRGKGIWICHARWQVETQLMKGVTGRLLSSPSGCSDVVKEIFVRHALPK